MSDRHNVLLRRFMSGASGDRESGTGSDDTRPATRHPSMGRHAQVRAYHALHRAPRVTDRGLRYAAAFGAALLAGLSAGAALAAMSPWNTVSVVIAGGAFVLWAYVAYRNHAMLTDGRWRERD